MYALAIGTFDGIHKGHQYILHQTLKVAQENNLKPLVYMIRYPIDKYRGNFSGLILPSWRRKELVEDMGFEVEIFDMQDLWDITHIDYIDILLNKGVKHIVCGRDFTFGKGKLGNVDYILNQATPKGLGLTVLQDLKEYGSRVSSTLIRKALTDGDIDLANEMLTRSWSVEGRVYEDRHVGFKLGFPTANIDFREKEFVISPKYGVYLVKSSLPGYSRTFWGLMNVGLRPTYRENLNGPKVEVYFMDFFGDLYGKHLKVEVIKYLREEMMFGSEKDLISQMIKDEDTARKLVITIEKGA
ncbi:MAG TPA: riboflavin biosynthesis protein RibF [Petrotogaceae bacterium]|nr:riboflavin biosynthesis protein RibF [Petrotogaceae bacterium]HQF32975.1 riboflavin biosynthesis protein RibF [Petrotogaceae bacterium]